MLKLIFNSCKHRLVGAQLVALCAANLVVWLTPMDANAHELEDGFVERAVAVVVRPDIATISYSIGANEATRKRLVASWSGEEEGGTTDSVSSDVNTLGNADAAFLRVVGAAVVKGTDVEIDGAPVDLELVEVIPTPRHHVEATVVMRLEMPAAAVGADSIAITVYDRNFVAAPKVYQAKSITNKNDSSENLAGFGGAFRYAIKGAKGVMLNRSTVAPILVRAKRRLVAKIPPDQIDIEQQFSAEVILP